MTPPRTRRGTARKLLGVFLLLAILAAADKSGAIDEAPVEDIDLHNKFLGIPFGTRIEKMPNMVPLHKSTDGRYVICSRRGEEQIYNGIKVYAINYRFLDGVFFAGVVAADSKEDFSRLKEAAAKTYGTPFRKIRDPYTVEGAEDGWFGKRVIAGMFKNDTAFGLVVRNRNLYQRVRVWKYFRADSEKDFNWER